MPELIDIEVKEDWFDVDSYESNFSYSSYDIVKDIVVKIKEISKNNDATKMITNANLGSILSGNYNSRDRIIPDNNPYLSGSLSETDVIINPRMKWSDNVISFYREEELESKISEIDPYGEEDWGEEQIKDILVFTLNIKDTKERLT